LTKPPIQTFAIPSFARVYQRSYEADNSTLPTGEVKNGWSLNSTTSIWLQGVHRDNLILSFFEDLSALYDDYDIPYESEVLSLGLNKTYTGKQSTAVMHCEFNSVMWRELTPEIWRCKTYVYTRVL
jgi:hypothetical protein